MGNSIRRRRTNINRRLDLTLQKFLASRCCNTCFQSGPGSSQLHTPNTTSTLTSRCSAQVDKAGMGCQMLYWRRSQAGIGSSPIRCGSDQVGRRYNKKHIGFRRQRKRNVLLWNNIKNTYVSRGALSSIKALSQAAKIIIAKNITGVISFPRNAILLRGILKSTIPLNLKCCV